MNYSDIYLNINTSSKKDVWLIRDLYNGEFICQ